MKESKVRVVVNEYGEALIAPENRTPRDRVSCLRCERCTGGKPTVHTTVSATHQVLYCTNCGLRTAFPNKILTISELHDHFGWLNPDPLEHHQLSLSINP